jgi:hypothetical protein
VTDLTAYQRIARHMIIPKHGWKSALVCVSLAACGGGSETAEPSDGEDGAGASSSNASSTADSTTGLPGTTSSASGPGGTGGGGSDGTGGAGGAGREPSCAGDWSQFAPPQADFVDEAAFAWWSPKAVQGSQIVAAAVPDMAALMAEQCLAIAKEIYCSAGDDLEVTHITVRLQAGNDFVAFQSGEPPSIEISLSAPYIVDYYNQHGQDPAVVASEIRGILVHEGVHGYSWWPKNAGGYEPGNDSFGYGEGIADYVRIDLGLHPDAQKYAGGHWNDGYTTTGFFIQHLTTKDADFARKINAAARDEPSWSWDLVCNDAFGADVATLWDAYQQTL